MKIVFVSSLYDRQIFEHVYPVGQVSLGTILKSNGYDVELVDFPSLVELGKISNNDLINLNLDVFAEYIYSLNPRVVSFLTLDGTTHIQIAIANRLKKLNKDIVIIFGGPHVSYCPEEMLTYHTSIDLVAIGEGEAIVLDIMNSIKDKDYNKLYSIPGIGYRDSNNVVVINPEGPLIEDLDTLPIPDFSLLPSILGFEMITIEAGRGCFGKCTYCTVAKFWKKYRIKSIDRILNEVQLIQDSYGHTLFEIRHDSIIQDVEQFKNLCKEIIKRNMKFTWHISVRVDRFVKDNKVDEELIKLMRESGCTSIFMGIESGSPRVQKLIKKYLNIDVIKDVLEQFVKYNIDPCLSFMHNFPFETDEDLSLTLKVINDAILVGVKQFSFNSLSFMGKTEISLQYQDQLSIDYDRIFMDNISNKEEFLKIIKKCPDIFYDFFRIKELINRNKHLRYLRQFVYSFMFIMAIATPKTYSHLVKEYNNDLLKMYYRVFKTHENFLKNFHAIPATKDFKLSQLLHVLKIIQEYISLSEAEHTTRIKETLKYEMDIINFIISKETNTINNYEVDPTDDTYNNRVSISLDRDKDKSIIYRKSTNYFTEDYKLYISLVLVELIKNDL